MRSLLVFQRNHCLIAPAEGRNTLQAAIWLFQQHDWTIAEHGMTIFCHVPDPALAGVGCRRVIKQRTLGRRDLGTGQKQCQ